MELREKDTRKVIAGLKCCADCLAPCEDCYLHGVDKCDKTLLQDAIEHIKELEREVEYFSEKHNEACIELAKERETKWISVEERLPEENGTYLIAVKGSYVSHFAGFDIESNEFCDNVFRKADITHWMSSPEPPKPKEPTFKDVFLEKFPKAIMYNDGIPLSCRASVFGGKCSLGSTKCFECWNQSYFDEEEEGEADA